MEGLEWECPCCTLKNSPKESTCEECGTPRQDNATTPTTITPTIPNNNPTATATTATTTITTTTVPVVVAWADLSHVKVESGGVERSVVVEDVKQESLPAAATLCQPAASARPASYGDEVEVFEFDDDDGDDGEVVVFAYADRETAVSSNPSTSLLFNNSNENKTKKEEEEESEDESPRKRGRPKKVNTGGREMLASSRGALMHQKQTNGIARSDHPEHAGGGGESSRTRSNRTEVLLRIKQTLGRDDTIPIAPAATPTPTTPTTATTTDTAASREKGRGRLGRSGDGPAWPDKVAAVLVAHGGSGTGPEIRNWVGEAFPEVKERDGWENAVRSCLSNSRRIRKGAIDPSSGYFLWHLKEDKESESEGDDTSSSSSSSSSSSEEEDEDEGRRRRRRKGSGRGGRGGRRRSRKNDSSSEYDSDELEIGEDDEEEDESFTSSSSSSYSSSSSDEDEGSSSEGENFRKRNKKRKKEEDRQGGRRGKRDGDGDEGDGRPAKKKRVIRKDDTTWPEKIDFVLRKHGGGGTSEEICNWIEESFPQSIAGKTNWRRTISASLSVDPGFVKGPPRPGEKGSVWTLYTRQPGKLSLSLSSNSPSASTKLSSSTSSIPPSTSSSSSSGQTSSLSSSLGSSRHMGIKQEQTNESKERQQQRGEEEEEKEKKKRGRKSEEDRKKRNWSLTSSKIAKVMRDNGGGKGRLCDICDWVKAAFPEDIEGVDNWRNRISNYLSHNTMFEKSDDYPAVWSLKEGVTGKGAWTKRNKGKRKIEGDDEEDSEGEEGEGYNEKKKAKRIKKEERESASRGEKQKTENEGPERKLIITSDGETWPAKIEAALKQLDGEATAAVICDLIEEAWPSFVANRGNWKNVVRATLSNSPKFVARKKREGATRWLLAEDLRSGKLKREDGDEDRTERKKKRKNEGEDGAKKEKKKKRESNTITDSSGGSKRGREEGKREGSGSVDINGEREPKKLRKSVEGTTKGDNKEKRREKRSDSSSGEDGNENLHKRGRNNVRWADKIADTMSKHGRVGTLSQIYDWFEIEYPEVVAAKPGWKKLISAYLSSGQQFFREGGGTKGMWHLLEK